VYLPGCEPGACCCTCMSAGGSACCTPCGQQQQRQATCRKAGHGIHQAIALPYCPCSYHMVQDQCGQMCQVPMHVSTLQDGLPCNSAAMDRRDTRHQTAPVCCHPKACSTKSLACSFASLISADRQPPGAPQTDRLTCMAHDCVTGSRSGFWQRGRTLRQMST
jgi:hypothetical protein